MPVFWAIFQSFSHQLRHPVGGGQQVPENGFDPGVQKFAISILCGFIPILCARVSKKFQGSQNACNGWGLRPIKLLTLGNAAVYAGKRACNFA
ncbi:protein of unknown function [Nitrospina watsonii]|uniref:Uncharacterized protein n=1 Tax=Nitrospina watsonii TaxID=1323948 RepID=A0ABN8VZ36_9BACT|nr:protein of unknown function [Nitrospina watsonii]